MNRRFGRESTAEDVLDGVDLSGRVFAVTGASSGLGEESARALASRGARVAMLARRPDRNAEAAARIRSSAPGADLSLHQIDLADLWPAWPASPKKRPANSTASTFSSTTPG